ncbi:MAG: dipeptidase [Bacillota bacterium]|nr:dipeptidase [Bacillota bacterium]
MNYIDFHCDTASRLFYNDKELFRNDFSVDIEKMIKGKCLAQFFAMFINNKNLESPFKRASDMIDNFHKELAKNKDYISLALDYESLIENKSLDKMSAFLTIEEGEALEGNIHNLKYFYDKGIRLITFTWNYENSIGYPHIMKEKACCGLKDFGKELVQAMNHYKMIIDVSHLNDGGFYDVLKISKYPVVASHSNSRTVKGHSRNLDDDMIRKLANNGGLMGLNFCAGFMGENETTRIEDMIKQINHIKNMGGIDVLALGSDFDGILNQVEIKDVSEMDKLHSALKGELSEDDIEKIYYKNALRVIKDVL